MVRVISKTLDELITTVREALQDGLIEIIETITYSIGTTDYILSGNSSADPRIYEIVSIEGIGFDGNYKNSEDLIEGTDYDLWDDYVSPKTVPTGFGNSSGAQVYSGITITDSTFEDSTEVYVRYKYHSLNMLPIMTDFSDASVIRILLNSILSNHSQIFTTLYDTINDFSINASGDALDALASIVGIIRTSASNTTGKVYIQNYDSNDLTITPDFRFVVLKGDTYIQFKPDDSTPTIPQSPDGGTTPGVGVVDVIAIDEGIIGNVGIYSMNKGFSDSSLTTELDPSLYTISNPSLVSGLFSDNYFDNGTNAETDVELRSRIQNAFQTVRTASYNTLEKAAIDTGLLSDAIAHDQVTKKGLPLYTFTVYITAVTGTPLSSSSMTIILNAVNEVKPVGSIAVIRQVMPVYFTCDFDIYLETSLLVDTTNIEADLDDLLTTYIDGSAIGEDIIPATMLATIKNQSDVKDVEITEITTSEFVSEPLTLNDSVDLILAGTEDNRVAVEMPFNSVISKTETFTYSGTDTFSIANTPIDDRVPPRIFKAVLGYDGVYRPSPLNVTDFFLNNSDTQITIDPNADITDPIINGDIIIFDYNFYSNNLLDGFRIRLNGDLDNEVRGEIFRGTGDLSTKVAIAGTQVDVTLDGTEKMYDFEFSAQVTFEPETYTYYIILQDNSSSGNSSVPLWTGYDYVPFNPQMLYDGFDEPSTSVAPDDTFEQVFNRIIYETFTKFTDDSRYLKIEIPNNAVEPEKALKRNFNFNFVAFEEN